MLEGEVKVVPLIASFDVMAWF